MNNNRINNMSYKRHVAVPNERINNIAKQKSQRPKTRVNTHKRKIRGFVIGALAATMVLTAGKTVIGTLVSQANTEKNTKEAITIASNYDKFEKEKGKDAIMDAVVKAEKENKLQKLTESIKQYESLKDKNIDDMQTGERQTYNKAFDQIASSSDLIRDTYIDIVKAKIATAYGIEDIQNIKIKSIPDGAAHDAFINITKGDDTINIEQDDIANRIFPTSKIMPKSLSDAIIEAAEGNINSNNPTQKDIVDGNINTWYHELIFANGVSYKMDDKGNIIEDKTKQESKKQNNLSITAKDTVSHDEER